ncbi:hypothetical protein BaRGS_00024805 [Batillaria attramentaria]|uniref:Uncharacterized protein n=1 Tax=Batillaria attramentaria TaxID=370345 RepID=A0ABD0KAC0_9CAEN
MLLVHSKLALLHPSLTMHVANHASFEFPAEHLQMFMTDLPWCRQQWTVECRQGADTNIWRNKREHPPMNCARCLSQNGRHMEAKPDPAVPSLIA